MEPDNITTIPVKVTVPDEVIREIHSELEEVGKQRDEDALEDRLVDRLEIEFKNVPLLEQYINRQKAVRQLLRSAPDIHLPRSPPMPRRLPF